MWLALACGCYPSLQEQSSGYLGCPPDQVQVTDVNSNPLSGWEGWVATCDGRSYYCSQYSNEKEMSCAPLTCAGADGGCPDGG